jgi:tetratricopeptide (TPR) repeat protein
MQHALPPRIVTPVIALIATIVPITPSAGSHLAGPSFQYLNQVQRLIFNDQYQAASSLAHEVMASYPDDPSGYLCLAIVLISEMFDREENLYEKEFRELLDNVESKASKINDTASASTCARMSLLVGHAKAYRSLWESHFGSFIKAITYGREAKIEYEKGLACDSSLYDLYFGLGLYHYWKSAKVGLLRSVGVFSDEREKGKAELSLAVDSSVISQELAYSALIWIHLDQKEYDSAVAKCRVMLNRYPDGKTFLWPFAKAYLEKKDYQNAAKTFDQLRERLTVEPGNYFNLIECDYYRYVCYEQLSMKAEAAQVARSAAQYCKQLPPNTIRRQRSKIAFLNRAARM